MLHHAGHGSTTYDATQQSQSPTIDESSTGEDTHEQDQPDYFNSNFPGEASDNLLPQLKSSQPNCCVCMYVIILLYIIIAIIDNLYIHIYHKVCT